MHLPQEQGLRPIRVNFLHYMIDLRVHLPQEQGLRLNRCDPLPFVSIALRVHLPQEQGLRLCLLVLNFYLFSLRVHLPQEQGLRLILNIRKHYVVRTQSASSTRTRIKTRNLEILRKCS